MTVHASATRTGSRHHENQDRIAVHPRSGTYVVADGIGGLADGAACAQAVVDLLPRRVARGVGPVIGADAVPAVAAATAALSAEVCEHARHGPGTTGAATALLLLRHDAALTLHLGDCRIYLAARDGGFARLTDDHTRAGQLTRFVGMGAAVTPGVSTRRLRGGDRLMLCTDGLTSVLDDARVREILAGACDVERACGDLLAAAVDGGATDDIAVVTVEYRGWQR